MVSDDSKNEERGRMEKSLVGSMGVAQGSSFLGRDD